MRPRRGAAGCGPKASPGAWTGAGAGYLRGRAWRCPQGARYLSGSGGAGEPEKTEGLAPGPLQAEGLAPGSSLRGAGLEAGEPRDPMMFPGGTGGPSGETSRHQRTRSPSQAPSRGPSSSPRRPEPQTTPASEPSAQHGGQGGGALSLNTQEVAQSSLPPSLGSAPPGGEHTLPARPQRPLLPDLSASEGVQAEPRPREREHSLLLSPGLRRWLLHPVRPHQPPDSPPSPPTAPPACSWSLRARGRGGVSGRGSGPRPHPPLPLLSDVINYECFVPAPQLESLAPGQ